MISNYIDVILRPIDSWTLGWLQCQGQEFNMLQMLHRFQIMRSLLNLKIWNKTKSLLILPLCILTQGITKALGCAPLHYRAKAAIRAFFKPVFFFKSKVLILSEKRYICPYQVALTRFWPKFYSKKLQQLFRKQNLKPNIRKSRKGVLSESRFFV